MSKKRIYTQEDADYDTKSEKSMLLYEKLRVTIPDEISRLKTKKAETIADERHREIRLKKLVAEWIKTNVEMKKIDGSSLPVPEIYDPYLSPEEKTKEAVTSGRAAIFMGKMWDVYFDGDRVFLENLPRIRYIWRLLESPNTKFPHEDLYNLVSGERPTADKDYNKMAKGKAERLEQEGLTKDHNRTDKLGENDRTEIISLIKMSWDKLMQANSSEYPDVEGQWEHLKKILLNEKGVKVTDGKEGPKIKFLDRYTADAEKARSNVTKNIKNGLKDIKEKMPVLHKHLKDRIKTDGTCRYEIDSAELVEWDIKWSK